ncbi:MAG: hypothetical protein VX610_05765 [SAR324 cluster bacterium]|nr:hypothetical protein [SAR324 cluster bacterium]
MHVFLEAKAVSLSASNTMVHNGSGFLCLCVLALQAGLAMSLLLCPPSAHAQGFGTGLAAPAAAPAADPGAAGSGKSKSEFQFTIPLLASGKNLNKTSSSESPSSFKSTGYTLAYVFKTQVGLGYTSSTASYTGVSGSSTVQDQSVEAQALEMSYAFDFGFGTVQLGVGSVVGGKVKKNIKSGTDQIASVGGSSRVNGSTNLVQFGMRLFGWRWLLGYRFWDYHAQHGSAGSARAVGNFNYSETVIGVGF